MYPARPTATLHDLGAYTAGRSYREITYEAATQDELIEAWDKRRHFDEAITKEVFLTPGGRRVTVRYGGQIAAVVGLERSTWYTPVQVWLLTTELVERNWRLFLRESRARVSELREDVGPIEIYVLKNFEASVRWVEWIGFYPVGQASYGGLELWRYAL